MIIHPIAPLYNADSKILILGSFPSVKSREQGFFYGHPQNRFWRVTATVFGCEVPKTLGEKKSFLLSHGIAVWDVIASCEIIGSSDSSIKNVIPNDLAEILTACAISRIFVNGKTAEKYYNKYTKPLTGQEAICLPSTSPANAACLFEQLCNAWEVIRIEINSMKNR